MRERGLGGEEPGVVPAEQVGIVLTQQNVRNSIPAGTSLEFVRRGRKLH